jgi:hypothetical protein
MSDIGDPSDGLPPACSRLAMAAFVEFLIDRAYQAALIRPPADCPVWGAADLRNGGT